MAAHWRMLFLSMLVAQVVARQEPDNHPSGGNHPALSFETSPIFKSFAYYWNWSCCFYRPMDYSLINQFLSPTHVILWCNSVPLPTLMCVGEFTRLKRKLGLNRSYNTYSIQNRLMMFWLLVKIQNGNTWSDGIRCDSFDRQSLAGSCNIATNGFHRHPPLVRKSGSQHAESAGPLGGGRKDHGQYCRTLPPST